LAFLLRPLNLILHLELLLKPFDYVILLELRFQSSQNRDGFILADLNAQEVSKLVHLSEYMLHIASHVELVLEHGRSIVRRNLHGLRYNGLCLLNYIVEVHLQVLLALIFNLV
jgi:hypothetical protein